MVSRVRVNSRKNRGDLAESMPCREVSGENSEICLWKVNDYFWEILWSERDTKNFDDQCIFREHCNAIFNFLFFNYNSEYNYFWAFLL